MIKGQFNDEPDYTAKDCLVLARDIWAHLPGTAGVFFAGHEDKWVARFDDYCFADLLNGLGMIAEDARYNKAGDKIGLGVYYKYVIDAIDLRERKGFDLSDNCRERTHMGQYFCLYDFAVACSKGNEGVCWLSRRVAADHSGLSTMAASRAMTWLIDHGWLETLVAPKQGGSAKNQRGQYRVVAHDEWTRAHGHGQCLMKRKRGLNPVHDKSVA
jgi:hypothetical protein